jgi:hypothetical protein
MLSIEQSYPIFGFMLVVGTVVSLIRLRADGPMAKYSGSNWMRLPAAIAAKEPEHRVQNHYGIRVCDLRHYKALRGPRKRLALNLSSGDVFLSDINLLQPTPPIGDTRGNI